MGPSKEEPKSRRAEVNLMAWRRIKKALGIKWILKYHRMYQVGYSQLKWILEVCWEEYKTSHLAEQAKTMKVQSPNNNKLQIFWINKIKCKWQIS